MKQLMQGRHQDESSAERLGRWIETVLNPMHQKYGSENQWQPAANLYEQSDSYALVLDVAGMRIEDFEVELSGRVLTVCGKRLLPLLPDAPGEVAFHLMEIDHGRFRRSFEMPVEVDANTVEASYRQGLLLVRIPKRR